MSVEVKKFDHQGNELTIRFGIGAIKAVGVSMIEEMVKKRQKNNNHFKDIYDFAANAGSKVINKKALEALARSGTFDSIHHNRNQIVQSVEIISKYAASKEEEKSSNQMSLFSSAQIVDTKPALKDVPQWTREEKLQEEFKAFGFFPNEHPVGNFINELGKRGVISSELLETIEDGSTIKLAGVVAYSKHKSGPKGRYAYMTLSDPFGIYETSIFSEELITSKRDKMVDGNCLVLECLVRRDQGGARILVKSVEDLTTFIKQNQPKKEVYQDIKKATPKADFDWKKRKQQDQANQKNKGLNKELAEENSRKRQENNVKQPIIIREINIRVRNSGDILKLKSFLSNKLANQEAEKFTKVYFIIKSTSEEKQASSQEFIKIDLGNKYLINRQDIDKIQQFTAVEVIE